MLPVLFFAALVIEPASLVDETQPSDVVVMGRKPADRKAAQKFVNAVTQPSDQQVARFHADVCPIALGISSSAAEQVQKRIRETARGVGAKVAKDLNCDANLVVIVADSGAELIKSLRKERPAWLEGLTPGEVRLLIAEPSPARAWAVTSLRNEDGLGMSTTGETGNQEALQGVSMMRVMSASIVKLPARAQIDGSVIVIDKAAASRLSLAQLADYAAMRGLARTRDPGSDRIGTILGLFGEKNRRGDGPREMTGGDIAYLQALYRSPGTTHAVFERASMAKAIAGEGR